MGHPHGNKTSTQFLNITPAVICSDDHQPSLNLQTKPAVNTECVLDFMEAPILNIQFRYSGTFQNFSVKLPITLTKFYQLTEMSSEDFFQCWKQLRNTEQKKLQTHRDYLKTCAHLFCLRWAGMNLLDSCSDRKSGPVCQLGLSSMLVRSHVFQLGCLSTISTHVHGENKNQEEHFLCEYN
uniref:Uncharacterized protein n=1 Tax=Anser brachyrhynchus TaxID=132585 RepID=A0A8B9IC38_9AVES